MVLTPGIIKNPIFLLNEENVEEAVIFLLGIIGFLIFNYKEKQLSLNLKEKLKIQREVNKASKDLTRSYSYIGEINRKLEIVNNISLKLAEVPEINTIRRKRIYKLILEAIKALTKTDRFAISFVNLGSRKIIKEIDKNNKRLPSEVEDLILNFDKRKKIVSTSSYALIKSNKSLNSISAFVSIRIKNRQMPKDLELLQTLATQALLLFNSFRVNRKDKNID